MKVTIYAHGTGTRGMMADLGFTLPNQIDQLVERRVMGLKD